jgi:hypothetical protein
MDGNGREKAVYGAVRREFEGFGGSKANGGQDGTKFRFQFLARAIWHKSHFLSIAFKSGLKQLLTIQNDPFKKTSARGDGVCARALNVRGILDSFIPI